MFSYHSPPDAREDVTKNNLNYKKDRRNMSGRKRQKKMCGLNFPPLLGSSSLFFSFVSHNLIFFAAQRCSFVVLDWLIFFFFVFVFIAGKEHSIVTIECSGVVPCSTAAETVLHIQKTWERGQVKPKPKPTSKPEPRP